MAINCIFALAYFWIGMPMLTNSEANKVALLIVFTWGFLGFRLLLDGLLGATRGHLRERVVVVGDLHCR